MGRSGMTWVLILIGILVAFQGRAFADEIHDLAQDGDLDGVTALLDENPGLVDVKDEDGLTPLHLASRGVHLEVVKLLVDRGADCSARDGNQSVPLHSLAARNSTEGIELLLSKEALIDAKEYGGHTALHYAAMNDAADAAALLIERGADIESRNEYERTPLLLCARERGGPETMRVLVDAGADVNVRDRFQSTPLELAAWRGKEEVIEILMDAGAEIPSHGPGTAQLLLLAASKGLTRLFNTVAGTGVDVSFMLPNGLTLMHSAASGGSVEIVDTLISKGLDINLRDNFGWTPIHYASRDGRVEVVERLIAEGAEINVRNIMVQSPLNVSDEMKQDEVRALLIEEGAEDEPPQFPVLKGDYLGQKPPGGTPEMFAIGIVSSIWGLHSTVAFSPDGNTAMWAPMIDVPGEPYSTRVVWMSERTKEGWTAPHLTSFIGEEDGDVPFFSPDGKRVYFISRMSVPGDPESRKERIWFADRSADGWSEPRAVDPSVNDFTLHWQFSVDMEHTIYFHSSIPEGHGGSDIYFSRLVDGKWQKPENLGLPVNSDKGEQMPYISPDGSYLLFSRQYDLYISYRKDDGGWTEPENLGEPINSPELDLCPIVTPDGKYLFFLSQRGGESHVWWVDAGFIKN
jgi:ankyrin repeat protein